MTGRSRRVRKWAGDRLRDLVNVGARDVAGDLRTQSERAFAQLSQLVADLAAIRQDFTAHTAASTERARIQEDQIRSVSQSLKYLAAWSITGHGDLPPLDLAPYEMRVYSQNGEDGVLLEILRRIGSQSKRFLEIGAQAAEANCVALAVLPGWEGTFVEADHERAEEFRRSHGAHGRLHIVEAFVTRFNVNDVAGTDDLDVFSLDIDGNDYWVWQALDSVAPRVVIIEHNAKLDPNRALVQPYDPHWVWQKDDYFGASRAAMVRIGNAKGYILVHAESTGANLFFVRADVAGDRFLPADQVTVRTPNYFLVAESHPATAGQLEYIDLDA